MSLASAVLAASQVVDDERDRAAGRRSSSRSNQTLASLGQRIGKDGVYVGGTSVAGGNSSNTTSQGNSTVASQFNTTPSVSRPATTATSAAGAAVSSSSSTTASSSGMLSSSRQQSLSAHEKASSLLAAPKIRRRISSVAPSFHAAPKQLSLTNTSGGGAQGSANRTASASRRHSMTSQGRLSRRGSNTYSGGNGAVTHSLSSSPSYTLISSSSSSYPLPDRFTSNLKSTDAYALTQYLEEARIAFQSGKYQDALTIYTYLESLKNIAVPNLQLHICCCRRQSHQEQLAITALTQQLKINEALGIHALGNTTNAPSSTSIDYSDPTSRAGQANDPEHIASSMVCEWERIQCWHALREVENMKRSQRVLKRMMDSTLHHSAGADADNSYACWMSIAKWLANHGYDHSAKSALEKAREVMKEEDPSLGNFVNEPYWLVLSAYICWTLSDFAGVAALAAHFSNTPQSVLTPQDVEEHSTSTDAVKMYQDAQVKMTMLHIASCHASVAASTTVTASASSSDSPTPSSTTEDLSLTTASQLLNELLSPNLFHRHTSSTLSTAYLFRANLHLLQGEMLHVLQDLKESVRYETRMYRSYTKSSKHITQTGPLSRFPYFGPQAIAQHLMAVGANLPPCSQGNVYELRKTVEAWCGGSGNGGMNGSTSTTAIATARTATSSTPSLPSKPTSSSPPCIELLSTHGGWSYINASSRYLAILLDFYSDLLLKYGPDPRLLFYRANLWSLLGTTKMQLHDLEVMYSVSPGWFANYLQAQTSTDSVDLMALGRGGDGGGGTCLSRVSLFNCITLHQVATTYGTSLFDKSLAHSAGNLVLLEKKFFLTLLRMPPQGVRTATGPQHSPEATPRAGSVNNITRSATPGSLYDSALPDTTPCSGLLECESSLYYEAVLADLLRQHATRNTSLAQTNAEMKEAQDMFEKIMKHPSMLTQLTPPQHQQQQSATASQSSQQNSGDASPSFLSSSGSSSTLPNSPQHQNTRHHASHHSASSNPLYLHTYLLCATGLSLIHSYRLQYSQARSAGLSGLARVWEEVYHIGRRKEERRRMKKEKLGGGNDTTSSSTLSPSTTTASAILSSTTLATHSKALHLTAPLLHLLENDKELMTMTMNDDSSSGTEQMQYTISTYWSEQDTEESDADRDDDDDDQDEEVMLRKQKKRSPNSSTNSNTYQTYEYLSPFRLLLHNLRRHASTLLSSVGIAYMLEAQTDTSLQLFYRAESIDSGEYLTNLYLFIHHFRFSPINLCIPYYMKLYSSIPYFIPNLESIELSPLRYPLSHDTAFSGAFDDPADEEDVPTVSGLGGINIQMSGLGAGSEMNTSGLSNRATDRRNSSVSRTHSRRSSTASLAWMAGTSDPTLSAPFPRCSHRCLTTRLVERPYTHSLNAEHSSYIQSLLSHVRAMKHRNELTLKTHRQSELVERYSKMNEAGGIVSNLRKSDQEAVLASQITPENNTSGSSLLLSLHTLHPLHTFHPSHQRRKGFLVDEEKDGGGNGGGGNGGNGATTGTAAATNAKLKPTKPSQPKGANGASAAGRSNLVKSSSSSTKKDAKVKINDPATTSASTAPTSAVLSAYNTTEPLHQLPPYIHVEHRAYIPSSASLLPSTKENSWQALHWHKEAMKVLASYDKNGVIYCLLKCMKLDPNYCPPLNYVLSLIETQSGGDSDEQQSLSSPRTSPTSSILKNASNTSLQTNTKHTLSSLTSLFGREKILPILWDIFIRGKQWEEYYGNYEQAQSEYSYVLRFSNPVNQSGQSASQPQAASLNDVLWRRSLISRQRNNITFALQDISEAIRHTKSDLGLMEKALPKAGGGAAGQQQGNASKRSLTGQQDKTSTTAAGGPAPSLDDLLKPHMSAREKAEIIAANQLAANAHSPETSFSIVRRKLEVYQTVRGTMYYNEKRYQEALDDAVNALELNEKNASTLRLLSLCYTHLKQYDNAITYLEKYLALPSQAKDYGSRMRLGNLYSFTGSHDSALAIYNKLLAIAPNNLEILYAYGLSYYRQHMWYEAFEYFTRCIRINSHYWIAFQRLGEVYERLENYDRAIETLKIAREGYAQSMNQANAHARSLSMSGLLPSDEPLETQSEGYVRIELYSLDSIHRTMGRIYLTQAQISYQGLSIQMEEQRKSEMIRKQKNQSRRAVLGGSAGGEGGENNQRVEKNEDGSDSNTTNNGGNDDAQNTSPAGQSLDASDEKKSSDPSLSSDEKQHSDSPPLVTLASTSAAILDRWNEVLVSTQATIKQQRLDSELRQQKLRAGEITSDDVINDAQLNRTIASPLSTSLHGGIGVGGSELGSASNGQNTGLGDNKKSIEYISKCLHNAYQSLQLAIQQQSTMTTQTDSESYYLLSLTLFFLLGNRLKDPSGKILYLLGKCISITPSHIEARYLRGFLLQREEKYQEAAKEYDAILQQEPDHILTLHARAYLYYLASIGNVGVSVTTSASASTNATTPSTPATTTSSANTATLDRTRALEAYTKILSQPIGVSQRLMTHANRGLMYFMQKNYYAALNDLDYACNSGAPPAAVAGGVGVSSNAGGVGGANAPFTSSPPILPSSVPGHALSWLYRAETYKSLGFTNEAIADYRTVAPLVKCKIEEAELEKKVNETNGMKKVQIAVGNANAAQPSSNTPFSFPSSANASRPFTSFDKPATSVGSSPRNRSTLTLPFAVVVNESGQVVAEQPQQQQLPPPQSRHSHTRSAHSIHLVLPTSPRSILGGSVDMSSDIVMTFMKEEDTKSEGGRTDIVVDTSGVGTIDDADSTGPAESPGRGWRGVRDLVSRNLLRTPTAGGSRGGNDSDASSAGTPSHHHHRASSMSITPSSITSPRPSSMISVISATPQPATVTETISLYPIQSLDHFRMVASPGAVSYQSELGLTVKDLDSIHNSLGILLHQRAMKKKREIVGGGGAVGGAGGHKLLTAGSNATNASTTNNRFLSQNTTSSYEQAEAEDEEALSYFSTNNSQYQARYNRGLIKLEKGLFNIALNEFRFAVENAPEFADAQSNYGVCLEKIGSYDLAAHHYTEALRLTNQKHLIAGFNLGNIKTRLQQYQEGIKLYTNFLKQVGRMKKSEVEGAKGRMMMMRGNKNTAGYENKDRKKLASSTSTSKFSSIHDSSISHSMRYESIHALDEDSANNGASDELSAYDSTTADDGSTSGFNTKRLTGGAENLLPFEKALLEHSKKMEREEEEKMSGSTGSASNKQNLSTNKSNQLTDDILLHRQLLLSSEHSYLYALIPLALNNRAICYQNLGRNTEALRGYTKALAYNPSLSYIKFNRAHLYMITSNCYDALEDIREYSREKAALASREAAEEKKASMLGGGGSGGMLEGGASSVTGNAIEREMMSSAGTTIALSTTGTSTTSSSTQSQQDTSSLEYLTAFHDFCKRYQWSLAVAVKDLIIGIRCMPILLNFNLSIPINPVNLFNPHMLYDEKSQDWKRLRELIVRFNVNAGNIVKTEYETALLQGGAALNTVDTKSRAILSPSSDDTACIQHVKLALSSQVRERYQECMDSLLKAIYLLPPSPLYLEAQRVDFARRHNLNVSNAGGSGAADTKGHASTTIAAPTSTRRDTSGLDPHFHAELTSDLHELLILWRARLQVFLGKYDDAVADLEFYVEQLALTGASSSSSTVDATIVQNNVNASYRTKSGKLKRAKHGGGGGTKNSDEDDSDIGEDDSSGLPTSPLTVTDITSRPRSRTGISSSARPSTTSWRGDEASSEEEVRQRNQLALYAHRQRVRYSRVLSYLGSLYHMKRRDDDAQRVYTLSIHYNRSNFYALLNRSLVTRLQGRYSNAITDLFEVLKIVEKLDEQQRVKEVERKNGNNTSAINSSPDPYAVPSTKQWQPEIETGLPPSSHFAGGSPSSALATSSSSSSVPTPRLRLSSGQREVHSVLLRYGEVLKLNPQESWDTITGLQGQLAIAVDAVLNERNEKKKKRVDIIPGGGLKVVEMNSNMNLMEEESDEDESKAGNEGESNVNTAASKRQNIITSNTTSSNNTSSKPKPRSTKIQQLSVSAASTYLREQLDAAAEQLMEHLIDPKSAREKSEFGSGMSGKFSTNLAAIDSSNNSSSLSTVPIPHATKFLDASFNSAFNNMHTLIQSQLPKKMKQQGGGTVQPSPLGSGRINSNKKGNTSSHSPSSFMFDSSQMPLIAASSSSSPTPMFPPLTNSNNTTAPNTTALIQQIHSRASRMTGSDSERSASGVISPTSSIASSKKSATSSTARNSTYNNIAPASTKNSKQTAPFIPIPTKPTVAAAGGRVSSAHRTSSSHRQGGRNLQVGTTSSHTDAMHDDDTFLATLDPTLSGEARAKLLDERRMRQIAEVREKFAASGHDRQHSFYGLLSSSNAGGSQLMSSSSSSLSQLASEMARDARRVNDDGDGIDEDDDVAPFDAYTYDDDEYD